MQLRQLDINLLRAFEALMLERNVTRAATRLALTQPAVSGMLNRLRDIFDDQLFVRTQRGVTPTLLAETLAEPIRKVLADIDQLLSPAVFEPASANFTVRLIATDYALRAVVQPFISALHTLAPHIKLAVLPREDQDMLDRMERGELDLALVTPETAPPELMSRRLFDEHYVCVMRQTHPAAQHDPLPLATLCELDHGIVSLQGGGFSGPTDTALANLGLARRVVVSVPSFIMLLDLVRTTDIVALLPARLLNNTDGLHVTRPPLDVPGFTKTLVWHPRTHEDAGYIWIRELMYRVCAGLH